MDSRTTEQRALRRLRVCAGFALALEAALYSAIAPLLPHYRREFQLSESGAGVLAGAYTGGVVLGAVAGAAVVARFGPRRTALGGFALLAISSVAFGFAGDIVLLDLARAAQGIGAGLIWSGFLAWLIAAAPAERRGEMIGGAVGAAVFGTMFGPVIGVAATEVGPELVFSAVAVCCAATIPWVLRLRAPAERPSLSTDWSRALRSRPLVILTAVALLPGIVIGAMNVLIPLRLDDGGFSEVAIGATFFVGALITMVTAPIVGRRSDRDGAVPLIIAGLLITAPALALIALVQPPGVVAVLAALTLGIGVTALAIPSSALLSKVAEANGLTPGPVAALLNLVFGIGETVGAPASAVSADLTSDVVPLVVLGGVLLLAILVVTRRVTEPPEVHAPAGEVQQAVS